MYVAKLPVFKTRLEALWNIFNPSHFIIILIMASIGAMNSYCLTELADYAVGLWSTCELERYVYISVFNNECANRMAT